MCKFEKEKKSQKKKKIVSYFFSSLLYWNLSKCIERELEERQAPFKVVMTEIWIMFLRYLGVYFSFSKLNFEETNK